MARSRSPVRERYTGRRSDREHDRKPYDRDSRRGDSRERHRYDSRYDDRRGERNYRDRRSYEQHSRERSGDRSRQDDRRAAPKPSYRPVYKDDAVGVRKHYQARSPSRSTSPRPKEVLHEGRDRHETGVTTWADGEQEEAAEEDDAEAQMAAMMGFGGFGTTKGSKVQGNVAGGIARPAKKVEYRQYMNRIGGFNRPISPS